MLSSKSFASVFASLSFSSLSFAFRPFHSPPIAGVKLFFCFFGGRRETRRRTDVYNTIWCWFWFWCWCCFVYVRRPVRFVSIRNASGNVILGWYIVPFLFFCEEEAGCFVDLKGACAFLSVQDYYSTVNRHCSTL